MVRQADGRAGGPHDGERGAVDVGCHRVHHAPGEEEGVRRRRRVGSEGFAQ